MTDAVALSSGEWRKLSAWSIFHFAAKAVIQNIQAALPFGAGAYGLSRSDFDQYTWIVPVAIIALVLVASVLRYAFYRFRIDGDAIQVRSGVLFKRSLNLTFERIQNVNLEHPFYFRPLGLVTLKVDSAGASGEEVSLAALERREAEAVRAFIVERKTGIDATASGSAGSDEPSAEVEAAFFRRSLPDLVIHGLTNNRAFLATAGIVTVLSQANGFVGRMLELVVTQVGGFIGSVSLVRAAFVFAIAFVLVTGVIACLSVLASIGAYYGFTIYRTSTGLTIKRGLLTRHEVNVRKSRIQTVTFRQDWLDYLLDRRNIVLEQISHARAGRQHDATARKRILVPSVRVAETALLMSEVLPSSRVDELEFTPIRKRYFYKHAAIRSGLHLLALLVPVLAPRVFSFYVPLVLLLWPPHLAYVYLRWKRAGLAVDGEHVVARSGAVGIDYHVFPAYKVQDVSHVQSLLMRRHGASTLTFHTASSTIKVPYLGTDFAKSVVDYAVYCVERTERSWM